MGGSASPTLAAEPGRTCWFLHGSGCPSKDGDNSCPDPASKNSTLDKLPGEGRPTASMPGYWGKVHDVVAEGCARVRFSHQNTIQQTFDAPNLRRRVCAELCGGPGCVIADHTLFTHSTGNLILAAAIDHGDCFVGGSTDWFQVNSPGLGSAAAAYAKSWCETQKIVNKPIKIILNWLTSNSYCKPTNDGANEVYRSLSPDFQYLDHQDRSTRLDRGVLKGLMSSLAAGSQCADKPDGIGCAKCLTCSPTSAGTVGVELCAVSKVCFSRTKRAALNCCSDTGPDRASGVRACDGMVSFASCELAGRTYTGNYRSPNYRLRGNHEDGTCRNGDAKFTVVDLQQQPRGNASPATATKANASSLASPTPRLGMAEVTTANDAASPCRWYAQMATTQSHRIDRPHRYSCPSAGNKGCVRDANGTHDNETACLAHCAACVPEPCEHGGSCTAQSTESWQHAEADDGVSFSCNCTGGYTGPRCETAPRSHHNGGGHGGGLCADDAVWRCMAVSFTVVGVAVVGTVAVVVLRKRNKRGAMLDSSLLLTRAENNCGTS
jgi:hypothetical protein